MLYQIYETQRSFMEPFSDMAKVAAKLYNNPLSPLGQMPWAQRVSAGYDLMHRLGKDYEKPVFGIRTVDVDGSEVAIHERVEIDKPFCELRRFKRFSDDARTLERLKQQPVVLIVAPLSGHYATLLRDTVRTMLKDHKVYVTDWKNARLVPMEEGEFHLDDYVNYVQEFIRYLQQNYGNCHVMSVCQPTVPVLAAVSLMASRGETTPLSMTMMGGPIDATKSPTAVNNLAMQRSIDWFENNVIYRVPPNFPGAGRRVYPGFMQHTGFVAMNPDRHATSHYDYFQNLVKGDNDSAESHRQFYDEYNAVLDMDAHYYLETIETVFQEFKLVRGTWDVRNEQGEIERVQPQDITNTGLLTVEGELDDISGSGQTASAHDLCTSIPKSNRTHFEVEGAGHYGIFSGRRWRDMVYPVVREFIAEHQSGQSASKTQAAVLATYTHEHAVPAGLAQADASTPAAPAAERVAAPAAPVAQAAKVAKAPVAKAKKTVAPRVAPAPLAQAAAPAKAKSKTVAPSKTAAKAVSKAPAPSTPAAPPSRRKAR